MILLDTHIWIWWVTNSPFLKKEFRLRIEKEDTAINVISFWEVAKAVEKDKLQFNISVEQWLKEAIDVYGTTLIPLDIPIIVESTRLPGKFHKDPADQLIVASARVHDIQLLTADEKILKYPFVKLLK